ncbi:MAG TPA: AMP-binding protein, partial [Chthoniobacterales bacterium]
MNESAFTIAEVLRVRRERMPDAPALLAPGRETLTWHELWAQVGYVADALTRFGVTRNDRVAVILPDGPEMASAFLGISACATVAPLNPSYRAGDFDFYLRDLRATALILAAGDDSPARAIARKRGIRIIELITDAGAPAGRFCLEGNESARASTAHERTPAAADDVALVLHTSGTTSRPKLVPLTHRNLYSSALHIAEALELRPGDRGLCVMPLFHIHGLVAGLLASVMAGASTVCTPGFSAARFFDWFAEFKPSWFTAVPTMHRALLAEALRHSATIKADALRFIRSSSAPLPEALMRELEQVFGAPVIEAYGMTEASHQIASNPLPPGARKPRSVGRAAGPEVAIRDHSGRFVSAGELGEIVISGANVTAGYAANPSANAEAFAAGWFRTGDQGYLDPDGYLFITGRLKEMINRGGEKVAPREVDDILLTHAAVKEAVTFSMPHVSLGEDVYAAVVLHDEARCSE